MSEFRDRLRSIRAQAEERASRLGANQGSKSESDSGAADRFRKLSAEIGDLLEELAKNFAEEFDGFESIRVAMDGGQCVRISRLEDVEGGRKLSRLTFNLENMGAETEPLDCPRGLKISCKGIVYNRERMHDEIEIDFGLGGDGASGSEGAADPVATARAFAEKNLLEHATAYEEARMAALRPIT